nr:Chain B, CP2 peptide [Homo sapiens]7YB7_C Chain C, cp2 peptide [Homo sapiens]7YB7_D Chain D, cp2 peptide [Homo sapiens]
APIRYEWDEFC